MSDRICPKRVRSLKISDFSIADRRLPREAFTPYADGADRRLERQAQCRHISKAG